MLTVISPAKNLDLDSNAAAPKTTQPEYLNDSEQLVEQLAVMAPHELSELMKLSDKLGQLNYARYQSWCRPFTKKNARPSIMTFAGDVYQGLQAQEMDADELLFAQEHLRILSGLYGILRPLDLIQAYRLEMGTKLKNERGDNLYHFWGDIITDNLNKQLKRSKAEALINLASNEYFKAVKPAQLNAPVIEPVFKDWKNGQYKIISFFAKKARGRMSAYIIKNRLMDAADLQRFDWDGYQFNTAESSDSKWVFLRKE